PDFVKVDEKECQDLILFAKNFASFLKYYNENNQEDGSWEPFVTMDLSVTLASLNRLDVREFYTYTKDIFDQILSTDISQEADLRKYFKTLFDLGFSITKIIDDYYRTIPTDFEFHDVIQNVVNSSLLEYYNSLQKYYSVAKNQNIIDPTSRFTFNDKPEDLIFAQDFNGNVLSKIWKSGSTQEVTFNGSSIALKIKNTATHNLFTGIFDAYLKALTEIVRSAITYFDQTISDFPTHSPHYALFLTFVKLFKYAQDHLNNFTARHLNLYYKEILKLEKQDAQPDNVHLIFELAKTAGNSYLLEKGTVFKAGKDKDGKEIFYGLKDDVVLGKGKVTSLKSLFLNIKDDGTRQLFASPVANSSDGNGASLNTSDKSWKPFGDTTRDVGEVGFAIASDYLYLLDGERFIDFTFHVPESDTIDFKGHEISSAITIKLSSKKGWFDVQKVYVNIDDEPGGYFTITAQLNAGDPPIIPYSQKTHGYHFDQQKPMALFYLKDGKANKKLWDFRFNKIDIGVSVNGIKNLELENDNGVLNPAKPFDLFGSAPYVGSTFLVGCRELFMKVIRPSAGTNQSSIKIFRLSDNVTVTLNLKWDNYSELQKKTFSKPRINDTTVRIEYLDNSKFKAINLDPTKKLFYKKTSNQDQIQSKSQKSPNIIEVQSYRPIMPAKTSPITFKLPRFEEDIEIDYAGNENYSTKTKWGFFRLVLKQDFGHAEYVKKMVAATQKVTITTTKEGKNSNTTKATISLDNPPSEPYTPVVKEVSLDYSASTTLDFSSDNRDSILHITPFGFKDVSTANRPTTLLPEFENEGELFIGFENLQTDQTLPVLFQVAEGSANPLAQKEPVKWYYLGKNNKWNTFKQEEISDSTNGLIKSGIIKFSIPENAVAQNTLMDEQLYW
ncbi:MAG TPA: hypothetical protein VE912_07615, partial [Bacteroidales bacterium]|nr:hypothetical protein [Bacteroidales bacterium]